VLLSSNAEKILELLVLYIQAPGTLCIAPLWSTFADLVQGVTYEIQRLVFGCLRSWVHAGELEARLIGETPLLDFAFRALGSPQLFEDAVDLICSMIHESQEIYDNEDFIQILLPRLVELKNQLASAADDTELMRGLTRIFAEAGETYRVLIIQHLDSFFPIVEAILECTSYHDLDVVPITFQFWFRLAQLLGKQSTTPAPLLQAYKGVMLSIIKHLHYAPDDQALTGQELDDFRSFRHTMGDTLKDCCYVLGPGACLFTAYDIIATALSRSTVGTISWQEIEAPIFAMRAMGGEIDPRDDQVVPKVMDLIPTLPNHPKLQYAAILLVSRYTEWLDLHPSYIPFQLNYISSGFQSSDGELSAAAAQAMKYLCKDCTKHLSDSLPQLHSFINTVGTQISQDDRIQIYEAIGHIIASLPLEKAATSMKSFAFELLSRVHNTVSKPVVVSKEELREVAGK
jgi:transportin-3